MKVWIINPFDNLPLEGYRPMRYWLMSLAFARKKWEVVYWTADFSHANKKKRVLSGKSEYIPFRLELLHEPPYKSNVGIGRMLSHWKWAKTWMNRAEAETPPDLIIVSSPPLAIGAMVRKFAHKRNCRYIVDIMDDWPGTFERIVPRWMLWPLRVIAKRNILSADAVTIVSERYEELASDYGFKGEMRRFYHGIDIPSLLNISCATVVNPRKSGNLKLVYAGNLGRTYDLTTVVEALQLMPGVTLDIAGDGDQREMLQSQGDRVRFHGYLDDNSLAKLLLDSDIGIVPMDPDSCVGIPYKFADYSKAGLPIVSCLGGESGKLLARYDAGKYYRAHDPQSLANAIKSLAPRLKAAGIASRRMAITEFDAEKIYSDYVNFAEKVLTR